MNSTYPVKKPIIQIRYGVASIKVNHRDENEIGNADAETRTATECHTQKSAKELYGFYECSLNEFILERNKEIISCHEKNQISNEDTKDNYHNDDYENFDNNSKSYILFEENFIMEIKKSLHGNSFTYNGK